MLTSMRLGLGLGQAQQTHTIPNQRSMPSHAKPTVFGGNKKGNRQMPGGKVVANAEPRTQNLECVVCAKGS